MSFVLHLALLIWFALAYRPVSQDTPAATPIVRYVELMRQNPRDFVEAPGKPVERAPLNAPYSDANRKASTPQPTGDKPTIRPGDGRTVYTPPSASGDGRPPSPAQAPQQQGSSQQASSLAAAQQPATSSTFKYQPSQQPAQQTGAASGRIDWKSAIKEVGKVASLGSGQQGMDLGQAGGGEKGFAENGPLSFETQWYDWGPYAESMVSRIRVNWYENMPSIIRLGVKGVVTIRFAIHHDGRITDVTMLNSSGVPPYDFAAKKAIELSSPLNPLPKDFPKDIEHVTCMFYYNLEPPAR
ncbi:MAG TPA: energy transducer TonB [Thermoanaerobaculia bacterium]|nr:energy transducer TonB [Thermoanaerobaculia bacterium]